MNPPPYTLLKPIKRESGYMLTQVNVRTDDQTVGDWLEVEAKITRPGDLERNAVALAHFAGLSRAEVERMDIRDFNALIAWGDAVDSKKGE